MKRKTISKERLKINKDGLVTHIEDNTLSSPLAEYEALELLDDDVYDDYAYKSLPDYSFPTQAISPTQDIAQQNVFSMSHDITGKMSITGDDADIEINGVSLQQTLATMQERLAILVPNPKLEKEFAVLHEMRIKYKQLEKELLEKKQMWDTLSRDD